MLKGSLGVVRRRWHRDRVSEGRTCRAAALGAFGPYWGAGRLHRIALNRPQQTSGKTVSKIVAAILFTVVMIARPSAWAADPIADVTDMQALRAAVKADKKAFVASALNLTPAEAKKFWPLYDTYQRALDLTNRERNIVIVDLVGLDKPMSDPYARNLTKELLAADEAEVRARRTLQSKVVKVLPPKKAARYLQLEAKIRAVQAYDIASTFPLIK